MVLDICSLNGNKNNRRVLCIGGRCVPSSTSRPSVPAGTVPVVQRLFLTDKIFVSFCIETKRKEDFPYLSPTFFESRTTPSGNRLKYNGKLKRSVNPDRSIGELKRSVNPDRSIGGAGVRAQRQAAGLVRLRGAVLRPNLGQVACNRPSSNPVFLFKPIPIRRKFSR